MTRPLDVDLDDPFTDVDYVARYAVEGKTEEPRFIVPISLWSPYPRCPNRDACAKGRSCRNEGMCDWREFVGH